MVLPSRARQGKEGGATSPRVPGKATVYLLLGSIILTITALRFPLTPHPLGSDTYLILLMADALSASGSGSWQLSPLSFFGFYPYAYPTGYPAVVSAVSQLTGFGAEIVIYVTALLVGILAALGAFVLCHRYTDDPRAALLAAFAYGSLPVVIAFSNWQVSARGPFLALMPFFLLALVARVGPIRKAILVAALLFAALAVHRMAILLVPVLLLYLALRLRPRLGGLVLRQLGFEKRRWAVALAVMGALTFGFIIPFMPDAPSPFNNHWWLDTEAGGALPEDAPGGGPSLLAFYIGGRWGLVLPFAVLGLLLVALREHKTKFDWVALGMVAMLSPFLPVVSYAYETLSIVAAVLAAVFLVRMLEGRASRRRLRLLLGVAGVAGALAVSSFTVYYRTVNYDPAINYFNFATDDEYSTSLYMMHEAGGMHVFNDMNAERKMTAIARLDSEYDFVDTSTPVGFSWSDFWSRFQDAPLLALRDPFTGPDELALVRDRLRILQSHPDDAAAKALAAKYDIEYLTVKRWGNGLYQPLVRGAISERYQVYASADYAIYAL
jgi:hypothetical protein